MQYPLHKEWMGETNRFSDLHLRGIIDFLEFAQGNTVNDIFPCPCTHCRNGKSLCKEDIHVHLLHWGMQREYILWVFHGETKEFTFIPRHLRDNDRMEVESEEGDQQCHRLNDLINDAFRVNLQPEEPIEDVNANIWETFDNDRDFVRLKAEAVRPLYENCSADHTTLYAMVGLYDIKSSFGLSGNAIGKILAWAKDLLPEQNTLPTNYSQMKKCLKGLGMKYKSIHVCKYDCILYRKEHEHKDHCPVCGEPRFVRSDAKNKGKVIAKVPHKVLKYFPIATRLKRLYSVPWISEAMTWHSRAEISENLMRHPVDSPMWRVVNFNNPEFANESRNVRLGISTDGFNPHGNLSSNQSIWPVILVPYNLPPSMCMREEFSMLSLLIPGPKAPSDDIDVFMAPLIEDLLELWVNGVQTFDSFKGDTFTLKAMLLWAIHDFPAYGTLSGCNTHGYLGCPICNEETESEWLTNSRKICYLGHRRFLPIDHQFRKDKHNFLPNGIEMRPPPRKLTGSEIEKKATKVEQSLRGKHPTIVALRAKRKSEEDKTAWSRRSILFDLPYWKLHPVRHQIDIMHLEKNIIEHLMNTCLDGANSKDGVKARLDLQARKIKKKLWVDIDGLLPNGAFSLSKHERNVLLDTIDELKLPSCFSSNLRRVVNRPTHDLRRCKSHDWHVLMQLVPLLFKHCFSEHKDLRRAIMQISLCFTLICAKVVNREHIVAAKLILVEAACILEKYFPAAFFDISIHLLVHICDEVLLCGPVRYRWMYPFERLMKTFKHNIKNPRYITGSIAEEYITKEASLFAMNYMSDPSTMSEQVVDEEDELAGEEGLGEGKLVMLSNIQYEQVVNHVFQTHDEIEKWKELYNASPQSKKQNRGQSSGSNFRVWVSNELEKNGDVNSKLARLAKGPRFQAKEYARYMLKGFVFSSYSREERLAGCQNSGVCCKALTPCRSSAKDKKHLEALITYYGVIRQILELDYISFTETVFYCDWVKSEDTGACKVDEGSNLVLVDLKKMKSKDGVDDEPFVCTFEVSSQVFYSKYINNEPWSVVMYSPKRLTTSVDALEAPIDFQSALDDNPNLRKFLDSKY